jgi:regulator of replication initiation timing
MALKAILESVDDLSEDIKAEYTPRTINGKEVFVLDVEGVQTHPDVTGLKTALDKQKGENKTLRAEKQQLEDKLKDLPEEFTLDEWHRLQALDIDENDPEAKSKKKAKEDERFTSLRKNYETQIATLKQQLDAAKADADRTVAEVQAQRARDRADQQLTEALTRAGVRPALLKAAKALHSGSIKHEIEEGELRIFVQTDIGEVDVETYVSNWAKTDEGKEMLEQPKGGGADGGRKNGVSLGNGEANPFAANAWNKTLQARLAQSDPVKAERLAKSAGFANLEVAKKALRANTAS